MDVALNLARGYEVADQTLNVHCFPPILDWNQGFFLDDVMLVAENDTPSMKDATNESN